MKFSRVAKRRYLIFTIMKCEKNNVFPDLHKQLWLLPGY